MQLPARRVLLVLMAILALSASAQALINPNFTPVHLVDQSETILVLEFDGVDEDGFVVARVAATLKGEHDTDVVRIDPEAAIAVGQREAFVGAVEAGQEQALLFIGEFEPGGFGGGEMYLDGPGGGGPMAVGFLHIDGLPAAQWLVVENWEDDLWDMVQSEAFLLATFNGGTDMLRAMVEYVLEDPEADVPVNAQARWADEPIAMGEVAGEVVRAQAVTLADDVSTLFVASLEGDRVYRWTGETMADVTDELGLTSRSAMHAWGNFTGLGRLDLASFDGESLVLHAQGEDGTFEAQGLELGDALAEGVLSLASLEVAADAGAGLVIGTRGLPRRVTFDGGVASVRGLVEAGAEGAIGDDAGALIVADLDGDGYVDVLQLGAGGGVVYRGRGPGEFQSPEVVEAATGGGEHGAAVGDFDQDGLLDVFVASDRRHLLWQNRGEMRFEEALMLSGEVSYKWTGEGQSAHVADLGNDGRDDLLIHYSVGRIPYILYNRGYRSFAHALGLDVDEHGSLEAAAEGQQAVAFGDFNGNGAVDLAMVLRDGTAWVLPRAVEGGDALAVRAALPAGEAGPVNVRAWRFERDLGVRQATADRPALIGARTPGPVRLQWQYPGGAVRETEVILEGGPVRVELER
ncbi:MAG: VCBS repeat-containing protein [Phycisphaeraceae bacterium]